MIQELKCQRDFTEYVWLGWGISDGPSIWGRGGTILDLKNSGTDGRTGGQDGRPGSPLDAASRWGQRARRE